jgi:hypothetical protein
VRIHDPSAGSRDGFGAYHEWSGDPTDGEPDFCIVNHNVVPNAPFDYSVINWNGDSAEFLVERADATVLGSVGTGLNRWGPFTVTGDGVLDLHEIWIPSELVGVPLYISMNQTAGNADLDLALFEGDVAFHDKFSASAYAATADPGQDEHFPPVVFTTSGYRAIAVHKRNWQDVGRTAEYEIVISTTGSAVDVPAGGPLPTAFALSAPRPNPTSGSVAVELAVPEGRGRATVHVYDLAGRRVASLADGRETAGRHLLRWDGRDLSGNRVAAGIYFFRLESPEGTQTRKVTFLR